MGKYQYVRPNFFDTNGVRRLKRISFGYRNFNQSWFQKMLFDDPSLIPAINIEPDFYTCFSVVRELPTQAGLIDLFLSPLRYLTIVGTKLIRIIQWHVEML